jgi:N-methylhydantoinase B
VTLAAGSYDPFTAQVIQMRLQNIVEEMATTLLHTSGSPVLTEAQDFCSAIFDTIPEHVAFSGYVTAHLGSSLFGVKAIMENYPVDDLHPGDAFIANDPYTGGALHQGDVAIISPLFYRDQWIGWAFTNAHVMDVGGMSPGGWAPVAYDRYGEGLNFCPIRIVSRGEMLRDWQRFIMNNVRLPLLVINDIKSMLAANATAARRLTELIDKYGLETYRHYCEVNKQLAEALVRKRIATIPEGEYHAVDWVEYDGHGEDKLGEVPCRLIVKGDTLTVDFTGAAAQMDGFVNAGPGAIYGGAYSIIGTVLAWDIPINAGVFRAMKIELGPPGTVVNPVVPAPVSCGHMETTGKCGKAFAEALRKACSLSLDPWTREQVAGTGHNCWPGNAWVGLDQYGQYTAFPVFDCGSAGIGAQSTGDGLDVGAFEAQQNNGIPDVETNEGFYPMLYLYRRLHVDSGGPGYWRGGQGLDFAWVPYNGQGLLGTLENACGEMPAHGLLGGYPGATSYFYLSPAFDLAGFIRTRGRMPQPEEVPGYQKLLNHIAGVQLGPRGVFRQITGGGGGIGDPLLRPVSRVEKDLRDGYISPTMAYEAYGVVWDPVRRAVDIARTRERRAAIRHNRLGHAPRHVVTEPDRLQVPLKAIRQADGAWIYACAFCDTALGPISGSWKDRAVARRRELVPTLEAWGLHVQPREAPRADLIEYACPGCATLLSVDVVTEAMERVEDYEQVRMREAG